MGFGDKLKDLRKQAQEAVSEHSEQLHNVLDVAGTAANAKTGGKHSQRIAKFGEKASEKLDKLAAADGSNEEGEAAEGGAPEAAAPEAAAPEGGAPEGGAPVRAAEEPDASAAAEPETSVPPPAPSSPPPAAPAANPDLAAWAAGDDSASQ
jgi:hypothetical protein